MFVRGRRQARWSLIGQWIPLAESSIDPADPVDPAVSVQYRYIINRQRSDTSIFHPSIPYTRSGFEFFLERV
jgi:hypothetical protein